MSELVEARRNQVISNLLTLHDADVVNNININTSSLQRIQEYVKIMTRICETYNDVRYMTMEDFMVRPIEFENTITEPIGAYPNIVYLESLKKAGKAGEIKFADKKTRDTILTTIGDSIMVGENLIALFGTDVLLKNPMIIIKSEDKEENIRKYLFTNKDKIVNQYEDQLSEILSE